MDRGSSWLNPIGKGYFREAVLFPGRLCNQSRRRIFHKFTHMLVWVDGYDSERFSVNMLYIHVALNSKSIEGHIVENSSSSILSSSILTPNPSLVSYGTDFFFPFSTFQSRRSLTFIDLEFVISTFQEWPEGSLHVVIWQFCWTGFQCSAVRLAWGSSSLTRVQTQPPAQLPHAHEALMFLFPYGPCSDSYKGLKKKKLGSSS